MTHASPVASTRRERVFTFGSGGWVLALGIVLGALGAGWNLWPHFFGDNPRPRGDGRTTASYGFDLATSLVPAAKIVSSGMVADGLPALVDPTCITPQRVEAINEGERGKYLVPSDRVIGVSLGGETKAYPLRVLVWHEVVNDTVGGIPVVVTYNPLTEGIVVLDRRVGEETPVFGVSGLLYNSGLLMYDRREGHVGESLWSPLQTRAVSGPAAALGATLRILPSALCRWEDWKNAYPSTTVLSPIEGEKEKYGRDVYGTYFNTDALKFPVDPLPPPGRFSAKTRVLVTGPRDARVVTPLREVTDEQRPYYVSPEGTTPVAGIYAFWFAWYANQQGSGLTP